VRASDVLEEKRRALEGAHGIVTTDDNAAIARFSDIVVLAVKPQVIAQAAATFAEALAPETLVVSVAAGVTIRALETLLPHSRRIVRAMPNTPALVLAGATAVAVSRAATDDDLAAATALFEAVGSVVRVEESLLDAVTGLSGSGPAYVMLVIEALTEGGVNVGLDRSIALSLATEVVLGSAKLLVETGEDPARLREMVTSPNGTTVAGLRALESGGLVRALVAAVESATQRSRELGREAEERLTKRT
ncbi:MAG TPA: pyrroline-5-carboxylate reductase, partial [Polyangiaceae bacterium]|nr:pyrroline-5-carboxylate reductase [Polyangiaceae bacterium]